MKCKLSDRSKRFEVLTVVVLAMVVIFCSNVTGHEDEEDSDSHEIDGVV
jgi:hypothetical protein